MPNIDFNNYPYFPVLAPNFPEHTGYRRLSDDDKERLLPIFEIRRWKDAPSFDIAIKEITETVGDRPFVLDLNKELAPPPFIPRDQTKQVMERIERESASQHNYNNILDSTLSPPNGFSSWRDIVACFKNAIPVLQFKDPEKEGRQILRQASILSKDREFLAIRVKMGTANEIYPIISQIISILNSPDRLLIIFDCGQSRQHIQRRAEWAAKGIVRILNDLELSEKPLVKAVCMSNSFMRPDFDGLRSYENMDWQLWREACEIYPFMFGDYSGMHRIKRASTFVPPDWRASVVYALDEKWLIYRHPDNRDGQGWIDGAKAILASPDIGTPPNIFGVDLIRKAAIGDLQGIDSSRFWLAAKVNIHLHTQVNYAPRAGSLESDE